MKQIALLIILAAGPISLLAQENDADKNFRFVDDFEKHKYAFQADTFELYDYSSDGGQLIAYFTRNKEYRVFDIWLFGETGKIHATYWTDKDIEFLIIKRTNFEYDKPYYEKGYKVTETTEYLSYGNNSVKRYNHAKSEVNDNFTGAKISEGESFFNEITKNLKIVR